MRPTPRPAALGCGNGVRLDPHDDLRAPPAAVADYQGGRPDWRRVTGPSGGADVAPGPRRQCRGDPGGRRRRSSDPRSKRWRWRSTGGVRSPSAAGRGAGRSRRRCSRCRHCVGRIEEVELCLDDQACGLRRRVRSPRPTKATRGASTRTSRANPKRTRATSHDADGDWASLPGPVNANWPLEVDVSAAVGWGRGGPSPARRRGRGRLRWWWWP